MPLTAAERQARYRERHPARWKKIRQDFRARHRERLAAERRARYLADSTPDKARAHVQRALGDGRLVKGPCAVGGDCLGRIEAHHADYSKPLEVQWLCQRHHQEVHS